MRKTGKWLGLLLALALVFALLPRMALTARAAGYSGKCGENVLWALDDDGVLTIAGTGPMSDYSMGSAPWCFHNTEIKTINIVSGVTAVGEYAFYLCKNCTAATLPDTLTEIREGGFSYCYDLLSITIPGSVKKIGTEAFASCSDLAELTLEEGVEEIGDYAFEGRNDLTSVRFPGSLKRIGRWAFHECTDLSEAVFEEGLETIGASAFLNCVLDSVTIPKSVSSIGSYAFGYDGEEDFDMQKEEFVYVFTKHSDFQLSGYTASAAEAYAEEHGFPFDLIGFNPFADVEESEYYYKPVLWAVEHDPQITNGTDDTHFSPNQTCTRGQVVTFLWRAKGKPEPTLAVNPFVDVNTDAYYYKAVLWALQNGITKGVDTTHFGSDKGCTRGQVVTFLWRAENQPEPTGAGNPFQDVSSDQYYCKPVLWAVEQGITKGTSADKFSPDSTCTRGQIVTFLYRDLNG